MGQMVYNYKKGSKRVAEGAHGADRLCIVKGLGCMIIKG